MEWKKNTEQEPPQNIVIWTIISDGCGLRNEALLKYDGNLWWVPNGSIYVYYTPTHWKNI